GLGIRDSGLGKKEESSPQSPIPNPQSFIALGPVASQTAIELLGSNGGSFFSANNAHPFENPTPLSNLISIAAIILIPISFAYTFGTMVGDRRQGWVLIAAMMIIFTPLMVMGVISEKHSNPRFDPRIINSDAGNMEGK